MKKNRNDLFYIFVVVLLILLYNIIFFSSFKNRTLSVWTSYIFTMGAFVIASAVGILMHNTVTKKHIVNIGFSVWGITVCYEIFQMILGVILAIIPFPLGIEIMLQSVVLIIFAVIVMVLYSIREKSAENQYVQTQKVKYVNTVLCSIEQLRKKYGDKSCGSFDKLYEIICYSDPMSSNELEGIEQEILRKLANLVADTISNEQEINNIIIECIKLAEERNRLCIMLK